MQHAFHVACLVGELRRRTGKNSRYSLRAFASFLGVDPSSLSRILRGKQELSLEVALRVTRKLKLRPEEQERFLMSIVQKKYRAALSNLGEDALVEQLSSSLRQVELRYSALLEIVDQTVSLGELVRDEKGEAIDSRLVRVNPAFEKYAGIEPGSGSGRLFSEVYPSGCQTLIRIYDRVVRTRRAERIEECVADTDQWFDLLVAPLEGDHYMVLGLNTTGRRQLERRIAESEARLAQVFESLPLAVGVTDERGDLVLSNREMRQYLPTGKIPSRDPSQAPCWRAEGPDGKRFEPRDFPAARALRGEPYPDGLVMSRLGPEGESLVRMTSMPLRGADGRITGASMVIQREEQVGKRVSLTEGSAIARQS